MTRESPAVEEGNEGVVFLKVSDSLESHELYFCTMSGDSRDKANEESEDRNVVSHAVAFGLIRRFVAAQGSSNTRTTMCESFKGGLYSVARKNNGIVRRRSGWVIHS